MIWNGIGDVPDVTVVIVLWNCEGFIGACLESLDRQPETIRVLCWDNASSDSSASIAAQAGANVETSEHNDGFPHAVNRLLERASDGIVLLLNPDVVLEPDCLGLALKELCRDESIGVVGANLRRLDGRPDPPAARRFRSLQTIMLESFGLSRLWARLDTQYYPTWDRATSRDVECINGAFMLARRADLRRIGDLDESVFLYLEDQLICHRLLERGMRVRFCSAARAIHVGGGPTEQSRPEQRAAAYLHRLDASLEIVRIRQGARARRLAIIVLALRCVALTLLAPARKAVDGSAKHRIAVSWLRSQWGERRPPPPVPS